MRWGVGKGRFRNLSAVVLSVFLVVLFLLVWLFIKRIEPLTVDSTPRAETAGIRERLLHPREDDSLTVTATSLRVFCTIADTVSAAYDSALCIGRRPRVWTNDSLREHLRIAHMRTRQLVAGALNDAYMPYATYKYCETRIIDELGNESLERHPLRADIARLRRTASVHVNDDAGPIRMSEQERRLIHELSYYLLPRLQPFILGLTADSAWYEHTDAEGSSR